jgi:hypothetical protein
LRDGRGVMGLAGAHRDRRVQTNRIRR